MYLSMSLLVKPIVDPLTHCRDYQSSKIEIKVLNKWVISSTSPPICRRVILLMCAWPSVQDHLDRWVSHQWCLLIISHFNKAFQSSQVEPQSTHLSLKKWVSSSHIKLAYPVYQLQCLHHLICHPWTMHYPWTLQLPMPHSDSSPTVCTLLLLCESICGVVST